MTADPDTPDDKGPGRKPREVFSVYSSVSGKAETFADPREAGRAFFLADPAERPSVTHTLGNSARTMARTEIHGVHPGGEPRYFKSLPASHAPDAAFREGFLEAMEQSLKERLGEVAAVKGPAQAARVDSRLVDDLESFAFRVPVKAVQLWASRSTDILPGPVLKAAADAYAVGRGREAAVGWVRENEMADGNLRESGRVKVADGRQFTQGSEEWER
ncbi:hypothetical protein IQ03_04895 [Gemmobacter caeni]|uniref:Uncharacterized protein n=1 Tax=Gemmobacter caeni TaxID=589035 RepID=A0A2T6ADC3_9RHOB|nr:hypothetical protein [Gemmobacter caeni]PTX41820.1 hypothetical protein C8N34_12725 [Gemmobacter caeni]TWI90617.1 hypothetical protein IQ03_04895 [Gemmobacter caeni]